MLGKVPADAAYPTGSRKQSSRLTTPFQQEGPSSSNHGNVNDDIIARSAVSLEYMSLKNTAHCPLGIYVIPSSSNLLVWDAVFFVHQGYYADSILKFRLTFPGNYPENPPSIDFVTDVFHPLISSSGSFNLAARFKPWRPKEHHVFHILHFIKSSFKKCALDHFQESDCFNKEAFRLQVSSIMFNLGFMVDPCGRYRDSTQSFAALATQSASLSHSESTLFELDRPSSMGSIGTEIQFRKLKPEQINLQRTKLGLEEWENGLL